MKWLTIPVHKLKREKLKNVSLFCDTDGRNFIFKSASQIVMTCYLKQSLSVAISTLISYPAIGQTLLSYAIALSKKNTWNKSSPL